MPEIVLNALIGSHPLAAMAAFGLLRCCDQMEETAESKLSWQYDGDWVGVLHVACDLSREQLVAALVEHQRGRSHAAFLTWNDDIKVPPPEFARHLRAARSAASPSHREAADFFAAYGSELATDKTAKKNVKPTAFHMTAGQQKFIKSVRELAKSLDPACLRTARQTQEARQRECEAAFSEALFGPWCYRDSEHSLGWDPSTEALHALSAVAPTTAGPSSVRAAVWLAFESLPLFPCFAENGQLLTTGFDDRNEWFSWPIWHEPISLCALRSLIVAPLNDTFELTARGIVAVYRARRVTDPNGRGVFKPAVLAS